MHAWPPNAAPRRLMHAAWEIETVTRCSADFLAKRFLRVPDALRSRSLLVTSFYWRSVERETPATATTQPTRNTLLFVDVKPSLIATRARTRGRWDVCLYTPLSLSLFLSLSFSRRGSSTRTLLVSRTTRARDTRHTLRFWYGAAESCRSLCLDPLPDYLFLSESTFLSTPPPTTIPLPLRSGEKEDFPALLTPRTARLGPTHFCSLSSASRSFELLGTLSNSFSLWFLLSSTPSLFLYFSFFLPPQPRPLGHAPYPRLLPPSCPLGRVAVLLPPRRGFSLPLGLFFLVPLRGPPGPDRFDSRNAHATHRPPIARDPVLARFGTLAELDFLGEIR